MTPTQINEYKTLQTLAERAKYLLQFEITAKTNLVDLDLVSQAFIGKIALPITGETDEGVVAKAKAWLEEKAAA